MQRPLALLICLRVRIPLSANDVTVDDSLDIPETLIIEATHLNGEESFAFLGLFIAQHCMLLGDHDTARPAQPATMVVEALWRCFHKGGPRGASSEATSLRRLSLSPGSPPRVSSRDDERILSYRPNRTPHDPQPLGAP